MQICNELVAVTDERYLFYATEIFWEGEAAALESSVGRLAVKANTNHPFCLLWCQIKVPRVIGGFTVYAFLGYEKGIIK